MWNFATRCRDDFFIIFIYMMRLWAAVATEVLPARTKDGRCIAEVGHFQWRRVTALKWFVTSDGVPVWGPMPLQKKKKWINEQCWKSGQDGQDACRMCRGVLRHLPHASLATAPASESLTSSDVIASLECHCISAGGHSGRSIGRWRWLSWFKCTFKDVKRRNKPRRTLKSFR